MSEHGSDETREQRYTRQTAESFASLGRYVQAFEGMVDSLRSGCLRLVGDQSGLLNIVFHHHSLTVIPLFEMFRGISATIIKLADDKFPADDAKITLALLKYLADEVPKAARKRNTLLHGTWYVGWAAESQEDFSQFKVRKGQITKEGLTMAETPSSVTELNALSAECEHLHALVSKFIGSFTHLDGPCVALNLLYQDGKWTTMPPWTYQGR